jgi:TolA-binding protein
MWGGALVARIQQGEQRIGNLERGQEQLIGLVQQTQQQIQQGEQRLLTELARHTSAIHEAMRTEIKASFEPLADLPGRVSRLEAAVFGSTPRARRTRRRSH